MIITKRATLALLLALGACAPGGDESADIAAIENLMRATWDRPDAPLDASPIVVEGDYAIADWTQGEMGGRALLTRNEDHQWHVILCAGDALRTETNLRGFGLAPATAASLSEQLQEAERSVSRARLNAMSNFEGVVVM